MNQDNFKDRKALVVGLGKSGKAAMQALSKLGAKVWVQDSKPEEDMEPQLLAFMEDRGIKGFFGRNPENPEDYDMLVLSPGVSPELDFIKKAEAAGAEVIGELEIAYRVGRGNYIAITGTNGKTTTTTLVGEIFKNAKKKTYVVGNIGVAVISKSLEAEEDSWLITETSSFQLETVKYFKPTVSAILNLTPDHLNRHKTMENYGKAKANVFKNQTAGDYLVINYDDKLCWKLAEGCKATVVPFSRREILDFGAYVSYGNIVIKNEKGEIINICKAEELKIIGDHNLENALAAAAVSYFAGIEPEVISKTLREFGGVAHRIEYCGEVDGIKFYNDSKGTNTDATITALKALKKNIILLAGGDAKKQDFATLAAELSGKVKHMMLYGRDAGDIKEAADAAGFSSYTMVKNLEEATNLAFEMAQPGDAVLLSPACASWDMYSNFEQRGDHFKILVERLGR